MSGYSRSSSPARPWRRLTRAGGFVSGVRWLTRGCGSAPIAERLMEKYDRIHECQEVTFYLHRASRTWWSKASLHISDSDLLRKLLSAFCLFAKRAHYIQRHSYYITFFPLTLPIKRMSLLPLPEWPLILTSMNTFYCKQSNGLEKHGEGTHCY